MNSSHPRQWRTFEQRRTIRWSVVGVSIAIALTVGVVRSADVESTPSSPHDGSVAKAGPLYLGVSSCSAQPCHGDVGDIGEPGCEYTTWAHADPHSRAYDVLKSKLSRQIVQRLGFTKPATRVGLCLECHATYVPKSQRGERFLLSDGVGCESCHGPAEKWVKSHVGWSSRYDTEEIQKKKAELGMIDTDNLTVRLQLCASCHVSLGNREVNHDLIAAGHPRLLFEAASYHESLARHWPAEKGADLADLWLTGQVVVPEAALEMLAQRAEDESRPWPELAEYDCYACHHDLQDQRWRRQRSSAGMMPWNDFYTGQLSRLAKSAALPPKRSIANSLADLSRKMSTPVAERHAIATTARSVAEALPDWLDRIQRSHDESLTRDDVEALLEAVLEDDSDGSWDAALQRFLSGAILYQALREMGGSDPALAERLRKLGKRLVVPDGFDSPRTFEPPKTSND
ncbi:hypothetical protein Pan216_39160 [Planctomycetes bacterium Pan216]|uniref:Cytochrome c-552/4 domain-containing protein n=1 Tax=Kolteria novifilia TaxID=2527975 RepID=A0A518B7X0_9BACT|nr:hypothetical protein Pan216_39160 [Planctomycetes bacterium Pan216]